MAPRRSCEMTRDLDAPDDRSLQVRAPSFVKYKSTSEVTVNPGYLSPLTFLLHYVNH